MERNMRAQLVFSSKEARMALAQLANGDLSRPMRAIALILQGSVRKNFSEGGRYDRAGSVFGGANKWKVTKNPTPLVRMGMRGGLMGSITPRSDTDTAYVSSDKPYAARQNFGAAVGARSSLLTHKTKKAGGTPARPWAVIQTEDLEDAKDLLRAWLLRPVR